MYTIISSEGGTISQLYFSVGFLNFILIQYIPYSRAGGSHSTGGLDPNFTFLHFFSQFLNCISQKCVLQFKRREATGGWDANFSSWHRRIIFCHHSSYKLKSKVLKILLVWTVSKCTKSKTHSCLNLKYLCLMDLYKCISIPHIWVPLPQYHLLERG